MDSRSAAAASAPAGTRRPPFANRSRSHSSRPSTTRDPFFLEHYGKEALGPTRRDGVEVADNAPWRRIDNEWLFSAETLALALNTGINNTSLVLAFELPHSRKVLLFAGDAQRGNWISWTDAVVDVDNGRSPPSDLLAADRALQGRPSRQPQRDPGREEVRHLRRTSPGWRPRRRARRSSRL